MKYLRLLLVALAALALASCSESPSDSSDSQSPTVQGWNLADGATDVGLIQQLTMTFSEDMDASTINDTTLYVAGRSHGGFVSYDEASRTASFTPDTLYAAQTWHDVVLDGPTDEAGNPMDPASRSFQTGDLDCAHLDDYLEPNDTYDAPAHVEVDRVYRTLSICGDNEDYYSFSLNEPRMVTVWNHFKHESSMNWFIQFLSEDGGDYTWTGFTANPEQDFSVHFTFNPGTYVIKIDSQDDPTYGLYDLELQTSEPCLDDEYEDNDFLHDAVPITTDETHQLICCRLDSDYFSFYAEAGDSIAVTTTQTSTPTTHTRIGIYMPNEQYIGGTDENTASVTTGARTTQTGTHYVYTKFWGDRTEYDFRIDIE